MAESESSSELALPETVKNILPPMVRNELLQTPIVRRPEFLEGFAERSKNKLAARIFSIIFCGRWDMTRVMWIVTIVALGLGGLIWWVIDLFRIPAMVDNYNRDVAIEVVQNMKVIQD